MDGGDYHVLGGITLAGVLLSKRTKRGLCIDGFRPDSTSMDHHCKVLVKTISLLIGQFPWWWAPCLWTGGTPQIIMEPRTQLFVEESLPLLDSMLVCRVLY